MIGIDIARAFYGKRVRVTRRDGVTAEGEFRGVWRDAVPYYPDVPCPALWLTNWGEIFIPIAEVAEMEQVWELVY